MVSRESVTRIAVLRPDSRSTPLVRLLARLALAAPFLRALLWERFPRSRLQRELIRALVASMYERFNRTGEVPTDFFAPDVEAHQAAELLDTAGTFRGHAGLQAMVRELREAWGDLRFDPEEIFELGDRDGLIVLARARAAGQGSGTPTERQVAHVYRVRRGSISRYDTHWDPADAFAAPPPPA